MDTRRALALAFGIWLGPPLAAPPRATADSGVEVESPSGAIRMRLGTDGERLAYQVDMADRSVIARSPAGPVIDGADLGRGAELGRAESFQGVEDYASRGVHSRVADHFRGARAPVRHAATGAEYAVEIRVFDDGVAFCYVVPGGDRERVVDEATSFRFPPGSTIWYHGLRGRYEGVHQRKPIADVKSGDWAAPPLTIKLPGGGGYASVTEAGPAEGGGMALQADGRLGFAARLGHSHPPSYPFTLRYGEEEARRLAEPVPARGTARSAWRVIMIGKDLNALVNCDVVGDVSPPPDPTLFPDGPATGWIKPGRAVWQYLDGGRKTLDGAMEFSRLAGELGFEYNIIEGFWQKWSDEELRKLVDFSKERGVGIWLWKHSREIRTPEARREFFRKCRDAGVMGVKLDFFDHEAKEVVDLYRACLKDAAGFRLKDSDKTLWHRTRRTLHEITTSAIHDARSNDRRGNHRDQHQLVSPDQPSRGGGDRGGEIPEYSRSRQVGWTLQSLGRPCGDFRYRSTEAIWRRLHRRRVGPEGRLPDHANVPDAQRQDTRGRFRPRQVQRNSLIGLVR